MTSYVKVENDAVTAYPYGRGKLRKDYPNTSFPVQMTDAQLAEFGVFPVAETTPPTTERGETVVESTPVNIGGVWTQQWTIQPRFPTLDDYKNYMTGLVVAKADALKQGGLNVNGFVYETGRDPFSLPAKAIPKTSRKLVGRGRNRIILDATQVEDVYTALDDFLELVEDHLYDLIDLIDDAESFATLDVLDIDSGWPTNGL